jgi:phenylpropionate dioxygenase-like ring-hydroxylating dioxygenase large terminal subunit
MTSRTADFSLPADWARTLTDPQAFAHEQRCLAYVWTLLGLTRDLAKDGDWIRAFLATRSVFVQRFGDELKGFENICAHRSYPLRNEDKGNGPVICGHHHWRYDRDGRALGIPVCEEVFGVVSRELGARLNPIEIATCGTLIFGRFPALGVTETLEEFLSDGFPILKAMSQMKEEPQTITGSVEANWRLCVHITLDDYHGVAVHPTTIGKEGYLHRKDLTYARFGAHSAYLYTAEPQALEKMTAETRDGTFRSANYRIFQILPNLVITHFVADQPFWYCNIQQFVPIAPGRSATRSWIYPAPFPAHRAWHVRWLRFLTEPIRRRILAYYLRRIFGEDNAVCERLQEVAHQIDKAPRLGALEERIGWFEESYRRLILAGEAAQARVQAARQGASMPGDEVH